MDFNWLKIQHFVKDALKVDSLPGLETVLFLIGLQEIGVIVAGMSPKRKLEVTYAGTCAVLSQEGYYEKTGTDENGWPLWKELKPFEPANDMEKNDILKRLVVRYFEDNYGL